MYDYNNVLKSSIEYFNGDVTAADVWTSKYALQDEEGVFYELTPDAMHDRLATEFELVEHRYPNAMSFAEIRSLLDHFKQVIPQGSPMAGIGNRFRVQSLSNCFVGASPHDSYAGILLTDQQLVQVTKRRGGFGFDISTIRPKGLPTKNAAKTTDGIEVFMRRYSNTCREVAQGGRRGALMLTLSVHHPDVLTFINIKRERDAVTGANISLRISDEFMEAVRDGRNVQLRWPVDERDNPVVDRQVDARTLWDNIVSAARDCAEPGLLFWDTVTRMTPSDAYASVGFRTVATNPCGELPMPPDDSCRLIVLNLVDFVRDPFTSHASIDYVGLGVAARKAQRLMDDLVDLEIDEVNRIIAKIKSDPEPDDVKRVELELWQRIKMTAIRARRTGLGPTGVGDVIAMMGHRYGDDASIELVEQLYKHITINSYMSSIEMAEERGHFPEWRFELDMSNEFLRRIWDALPVEWQERWRRWGRRNIANTTTAPAGSVSICSQTTSGIEPAIYTRYLRRKKGNPDDPGFRVDSKDTTGDTWMHFPVVHHGVLKWFEVVHGQEAAAAWLADTEAVVPEECPYNAATAAEIDWRAKVRLQAAAQRWVCHAISNTTNLPADISVDVVKDIYMLGWELGCKGVTIYREGSRDGVLVRDVEQTDNTQTFTTHHVPARPDSLPCHIHRARIKSEEWVFFVGLMDDRPYEVFGGLASCVSIPQKYEVGTISKRQRKNGGLYDLTFGAGDDVHVIKNIVEQFDNPNYSAFTRIVSLSLRHGAAVQYVVEQLLRDKDADMSSFARVLARTLKRYIDDGTPTGRRCPNCDAEGTLFYTEGCVTCQACGFAACG